MIKYIAILAVSLSALSGCKDYGARHGLVAGGAVCAAGYALKSMNVDSQVIDTVQIGVGVLATGYYYNRERSARGDIPFDKWDGQSGSRDSQADAATPAITSMIAVAAC